MITSKTIRTVTDMRRGASDLLSFVARLKQPVGILQNNKLAAYLVDPETLEALEASVEDYLDLQTVTSRLNKAKKSDFRDFEAFWKRENLPH